MLLGGCSVGKGLGDRGVLTAVQELQRRALGDG